MRNPITSIIGALELAGTDQEKLSEQANEMFEIASNCSETLLAIVNNVMDYSKICAGKLDLQLQCVDYVDLVRRIVQQQRIHAEQKKLMLDLYVINWPHQNVQLDYSRVSQILINLLSNAIKFTKRGGVSVHLSLLNQKKRTLSA